MPKERGTYNRRNWTQRWKERVLNSAKEKQEKLARRYNIGSWKKQLAQQPPVQTRVEPLIQATPGQFKKPKKGLKNLFGLVKNKSKK